MGDHQDRTQTLNRDRENPIGRLARNERGLQLSVLEVRHPEGQHLDFNQNKFDLHRGNNTKYLVTFLLELCHFDK